ncbi:MAG: hypothetical protein GY850_47055, partial [bacterium]|nr:hypothetical protein [bacterium]
MLKERKEKLSGEPAQQKPLRLWPGVVIVMLLWLVRFVVPNFVSDANAIAAFGALLGGLAVIVWWAFFSRAPGFDRWGAVILMIIALIATPLILHESIATAGMGILFLVYVLPGLSLAFVVWAVAGRHLSDVPRRVTMAAAILLACGVWAFVRTGGITNDLNSDFAWRWAETPEEQLLGQYGG